MANVNERVRKHRDKLRAAGLRSITLWVPDTNAPGFAEECRRESRIIADAEKDDDALDAFLEAAAADIEGWEP